MLPINENLKQRLYDLWLQTTDENNEWFEKEVGGYFQVRDDRIYNLDVLGAGEEGHTMHPCCRKYIWHTHPFSDIFAYNPPSAHDLVGTLAWGGPDNEDNEDGALHTDGEAVATQNGLWTYEKDPALKEYYDSLDTLEKRRCFFYLVQFYCVVVGTLFQNKTIPEDKFIDLLKTIDVPYIVSVLQKEKNVDFRTYLESQMRTQVALSYLSIENVEGIVETLNDQEDMVLVIKRKTQIDENEEECSEEDKDKDEELESVELTATKDMLQKRNGFILTFTKHDFDPNDSDEYTYESYYESAEEESDCDENNSGEKEKEEEQNNNK